MAFVVVYDACVLYPAPACVGGRSRPVCITPLCASCQAGVCKYASR